MPRVKRGIKIRERFVKNSGLKPRFFRRAIRGFIQKFYVDDQSTVANPLVSVINDIIERAKQELQTRNQNIAGHPLQYGSKGEWNGLDLTVDGFTGDGGIRFKAKDQQDHARIYDFARENRGLVMPWQIDPANFR